MFERKTLAAATAVAALAIVPLAPARAASNDPYFSRQWGLAVIQAEEAWEVSTGAGTLIAIVDSGVDLAHPDLVAKIVSQPDADLVEPKGNCAKDNDTGCVQDGPQDEYGHGTHVAGIAAATANNGIGIAGTAPGASILPVRVLDEEGNGNTQLVAAGIRYAADSGAKVINVSIAFSSIYDDIQATVTGSARPVHAATEYAWSRGAVVVFAAGNNSSPFCNQVAASGLAVCVGATDSRDIRTYYTDSDVTMGKRYLVAPGGDDFSCAGEILSTYLASAAHSSCSPSSGYDVDSGTSMAAPFVSGVAALLSSQGIPNTRIVECLASTADDLGIPGRDPIYGWGRVNALSALTGC